MSDLKFQAVATPLAVTDPTVSWPHAGPGAFTLIELLVVISLITLLIAILLPVLSAATEAGRNAQCRANLKQIALGHIDYMGDYNQGFAPVYSHWNDGTHLEWCFEYISDYVPGGYVKQGTSANANPLKYVSQNYRCPTNPVTFFSSGANTVYANYSWNGYLAYDLSINLPGPCYPEVPTDNQSKYWFRDTDVEMHYSKTVMVMDGTYYDGSATISQSNSNADYLGYNNTHSNAPFPDYFHQAHNNYNGTLNAAFTDGHVNNFGYGKIKSNWFKLRQYWQDSDLVFNEPLKDP